LFNVAELLPEFVQLLYAIYSLFLLPEAAEKPVMHPLMHLQAVLSPFFAFFAVRFIYLIVARV
jgi:hypothetical protein